MQLKNAIKLTRSNFDTLEISHAKSSLVGSTYSSNDNSHHMEQENKPLPSLTYSEDDFAYHQLPTETQNQTYIMQQFEPNAEEYYGYSEYKDEYYEDSYNYHYNYYDNYTYDHQQPHYTDANGYYHHDECYNF